MEALLAMMKAQMEQQTRSQAAMIKMLHTLTTKAPPPPHIRLRKLPLC